MHSEKNGVVIGWKSSRVQFEEWSAIHLFVQFVFPLIQYRDIILPVFEPLATFEME